MEVEKEHENKINKRTNPTTRFPKTYSTFVVAFSLKETYDDLATAQQMICNKYSPQDSVNSITPTNSANSVKNVAHELSEKLEEVSAAELQTSKEDKNDTIIVIEENAVITNQNDIEIANKEDNEINTDNTKNKITYRDNKETIRQENIKSSIFAHVDSAKIITDDQIKEVEQIQDYSLFIEYPVEDSRESNKVYLDNSQEQDHFNYDDQNLLTNTCYDSEKIGLNESPKTDNCIKIEIETEDNCPKIIFNATAHQKCKQNKFPKRKMRKHKTVKKIYFKSNHLRNIIQTRINRYCNKKKINIMCPKHIKTELYPDSNTIILSRERLLKNVSAKENLIEEIDLTYVKDTSSNMSMVSFPSTTKKSSMSNASDNTLIRKDSRTLQKEEAVDTVNPVIEIPPEKVYNSDVIVAEAAVTYDITMDITVLPNQKYLNLECLTSNETLKAFDQDIPLTSNSDKLTSSPQQKEVSKDTLVHNESSFGVSSSYEAYHNAKTSSEFDIENDADYPQMYETAFHQINEKKQKCLLDTVINLGMDPDTPSTSSGATNEIEQDNVIVTSINKYSYEPKYVNGTSNQDLNKNVLKKTNQKPNIKATKTIILPNQKDIQILIDENETLQQKCAEEARNPTNSTEIWEKLVSVIDQAVKRLEDTITDKIVGELKKSLAGFELLKKTSKGIEPNRDVKMMSGDIAVYNKEVSTREIKTETEQGLQCDLIHNNVIDEIMKKLSSDGPQIITTTTKSLPKIKPNVFGDIVEIIKPPLSPLERGETVTISTLTRGSEFQRFSRLKTMFRPPLNFIKENVFVLTSVPTFFIVLLCLYGLVILKPL